MHRTFAMLLLSLGLLAPDAAAAARWHEQYGTALRTAKRLGRPLLVVIDSSSTPESRIEPARFRANDKAQESLLSPYVLCHIDVTTDYGKLVAKAFRATQFPHTAIIDRTGSVILHRKRGAFTPAEWATTLAKFRTGERVRKQAAVCYT
jgi:hypothetical protein